MEIKNIPIVSEYFLLQCIAGIPITKMPKPFAPKNN